ncbi:MAG: universal stress protein [Dehalococcoidia bacterium]|jgi:nucleotide-binding universal stress UspA family protein|nr:MAG: universal stress protein [Dehalococcoidia bacterium]
MYRHIMVPLDGSELAECVLPHAGALAKLLKGKEKISLVRVVPPLRLYEGAEAGLPPEERNRLEDEGIRVARDYLKGAADRLNQPGITVATEVLSGQVVDQLNEFIRDNSVDLVILATHGRSGISRFFAGSTAERLIRSSTVPVLAVRPPGCSILPS